jgi:hypothetical protein
MKVERRQPTAREWAAITSSRPLVRHVMSGRPENLHTSAPMRAERRSIGKRESARQARRNVTRVLQLAGVGLSPPKIAAAVGLSESAVPEILERVRGGVQRGRNQP